MLVECGTQQTLYSIANLIKSSRVPHLPRELEVQDAVPNYSLIFLGIALYFIVIFISNLMI